MKKSDYDNLSEIEYTGGFMWRAVNQNSIDEANQLKIGEKSMIEFKTKRDISFHRCYFLLLSFIWGYMPNKFKVVIVKNKFYYWLKHLKKEYKIIYSFTDEDKQEDIASYCLDLGISTDNAAKIAQKFGKTDLLEYDSISFGRMSQEKFEAYIKEQLPWIYQNVIGKVYSGDKYSAILETIESEFKIFLSKLQ